VTIRRRAEVGDRVRSLRKWRKLSQEALGHLVGVGRESIMAIESGRSGVTLDVILDVAEVLRVPATWLLSDDWTRDPTDPGDVPSSRDDTLPPR
jgi:transcriptional regulator with XRE-family HTH domain